MRPGDLFKATKLPLPDPKLQTYFPRFGVGRAEFPNCPCLLVSRPPHLEEFPDSRFGLL